MNHRVFLLNTNENGTPFQNCLIYYVNEQLLFCIWSCTVGVYRIIILFVHLNGLHPKSLKSFENYNYKVKCPRVLFL